MKNEKILDKIKKCLALSKSSNSNEAATALRQAQALMKKYGIKQDQVDLSDVNSAYAAVGKVQNPARYHQMLVGLICDAFGVEAIYKVERLFSTKTTIEFIGIDAQPIIASYTYEVLYRQLKRDRTDFMKNLNRFKRANKTRKADLFAEGWVQSVWSKVTSFAQPEEHKDLIKRYKETNHKNLGKAKDRKHKVTANDDGALSAGYESGSKANLHHGMDGEAVKRLSNAL